MFVPGRQTKKMTESLCQKSPRRNDYFHAKLMSILKAKKCNTDWLQEKCSFNDLFIFTQSQFVHCVLWVDKKWQHNHAQHQMLLNIFTTRQGTWWYRRCIVCRKYFVRSWLLSRISGLLELLLVLQINIMIKKVVLQTHEDTCVWSHTGENTRQSTES